MIRQGGDGREPTGSHSVGKGDGHSYTGTPKVPAQGTKGKSKHKKKGSGKAPKTPKTPQAPTKMSSKQRKPRRQQAESGGAAGAGAGAGSGVRGTRPTLDLGGGGAQDTEAVSRSATDAGGDGGRGGDGGGDGGSSDSLHLDVGMTMGPHPLPASLLRRQEVHSSSSEEEDDEEDEEAPSGLMTSSSSDSDEALDLDTEARGKYLPRWAKVTMSTFSGGERGLAVYAFLMELKVKRAMHGLSEKGVVRLGMNHVRGQAYQRMFSADMAFMKHGALPWTTFKEFATYMQSLYGLEDPDWHLSQEVQRQQGHKESVRDYLAAKTTMLGHMRLVGVKPPSRTRLLESVLRGIRKSHLRVAARTWCHQQGPRTTLQQFEEWVIATKFGEDVSDEETGGRVDAIRAIGAAAGRGAGTWRDEPWREERGRPARALPACWVCGSIAHFKRDCPKRHGGGRGGARGYGQDRRRVGHDGSRVSRSRGAHADDRGGSQDARRSGRYQDERARRHDYSGGDRDAGSDGGYDRGRGYIALMHVQDGTQAEQRPVVMAKLNDRPVRLLLDTGAQVSVIGDAWVRHHGVDSHGAADELCGFGDGAVTVTRSVRATIKPAKGDALEQTLLMVPAHKLGPVDVVLGVDNEWVRALFQSHTEDALDITWSGGAVRLDSARSPASRRQQATVMTAQVQHAAAAAREQIPRLGGGGGAVPGAVQGDATMKRTQRTAHGTGGASAPGGAELHAGGRLTAAAASAREQGAQREETQARKDGTTEPGAKDTKATKKKMIEDTRDNMEAVGDGDDMTTEEIDNEEAYPDVCKACGDGGQLLECDNCLSCMHAECDDIEVPPAATPYLCPDCLPSVVEVLDTRWTEGGLQYKVRWKKVNRTLWMEPHTVPEGARRLHGARGRGRRRRRRHYPSSRE